MATTSNNASNNVSNGDSIHVSVWTRIRKWFSFNRLTVLGEHYYAIREQLAPATAAERAEVEYLGREFEKYYKKTNSLTNWRVFFYIIMYAAFFTSVLKVIPFLKFLVEFIDLGNALIGSGIAVIIIFFLTVRINLNIIRMQGVMMHFTAMYHANKKRDHKQALKKISRVI